MGRELLGETVVHMTLFEYLAIAFGLLYSVAALRVLGGLPAALGPERRYALHLGLTFILLGLIAISFWTFFSLRDVAWTFRGFSTALLVPGLLYYCAAVLVPENPEDVSSWREHYFAVRRRMYGGLTLWGVGAALSATVNLGMPFLHPARFVQATGVTLGLTGLLISKPRAHAVLITLMAVLLIGAALSPGLDADWLARP
jgi:hypothetical protein